MRPERVACRGANLGKAPFVCLTFELRSADRTTCAYSRLRAERGTLIRVEAKRTSKPTQTTAFIMGSWAWRGLQPQPAKVQVLVPDFHCDLLLLPVASQDPETSPITEPLMTVDLNQLVDPVYYPWRGFDIFDDSDELMWKLIGHLSNLQQICSYRRSETETIVPYCIQ